MEQETPQTQQEVGLNQGPTPNPSHATVPPTPPIGTAPPEETPDNYWTKEGRILLHSKPPTAYAWSYPGIGKNKVFRPQEDEADALPESLVKEIIRDYQKEAKPFCGSGPSTTDGPSIVGKKQIPSKDSLPLGRIMVSEIELALYWDRHPFEFKPQPLDTSKRAKSAQNLSQLKELLVSSSPQEESRRGSSIPSNPDNHKGHRRSSSACTVKSSQVSSRGSIELPLTDKHPDPKSSSPQSNPNPKMPKILQVLNKNEKRQFTDLQPPPRQSAHYHRPKPGKLVADRESNTSLNNYYDNSNNSDQRERYRIRNSNSIGVQVSLDRVMTAALKSTYLCPLHGQYRQGVDRRAKMGFRTELATTGSRDAHAHCSRSKSRSRTKLVKTVESQTEADDGIIGGDNQRKFRNNAVRSKTAPAIRRNANVDMISESNANFRNPGLISAAENRKLRNKILSYCFTKHSIF